MIEMLEKPDDAMRVKLCDCCRGLISGDPNRTTEDYAKVMIRNQANQ